MFMIEDCGELTRKAVVAKETFGLAATNVVVDSTASFKRKHVDQGIPSSFGCHHSDKKKRVVSLHNRHTILSNHNKIPFSYLNG